MKFNTPINFTLLTDLLKSYGDVDEIVFKSHSSLDEHRIAEICVIADSPDPVPPCGGCRQKIAEFADQSVMVTLCTTDGASKSMTVAEMLPGVFSAAHMDRT